jgi:transcriptional regulator with XRE-family HTH domain
VSRGPVNVAQERRAAFGRRLRELRETRGWSQEHLALTAGVDRSFLAEVETAKVSIALDRMILLADALEVGVAEFFVADVFRHSPKGG